MSDYASNTPSRWLGQHAQMDDQRTFVVPGRRLALICQTVIDGNPIPKGRPRHVTRTKKSGETFVATITPDRTLAAEGQIGTIVKRDKHPDHEPDDREYVVELWFWTDGRRDRRADVDNLQKTVLDGLNQIVWNDDRQVVQLHGYVFRDAEHPRLGLRIWRVEGPTE